MAEIITTRGHRILVDDEVFEHLSKNKWYLDGVYRYPTRISRGRRIRMHRLIMGLGFDDPRVVDHINGDTLDNRSENLRVCTQGQNARNTRLSKNNKTGFKGVMFLESRNRFIAKIKFNRKDVYLGSFKTAEEAHAAYCRAADMLHGEFANHGVNKK